MPKSKKIIVKFKDNFHKAYAGYEPVMIKSIEELGNNDLGIRITFGSNMDTVKSFLAFVGDEELIPCDADSISISFIDNEEIQEFPVRVKAVFEDGAHSEGRSFLVKYISTKFYETQKMSNHPSIVMVAGNPPVNQITEPPDRYVSQDVTDEERAFAQETWGNLVRAERSDYDNAKELAKQFMHELWPNAGFPSDAMNGIRPFEQYERMVSGKDHGYCSNFADIYVHACKALGILCRRIHMQEIYSDSDAFRVQLGSMHSTTEIFDSSTNQWVWIDLRYYALGVFLGQEGPLNTGELHLFLQQSARRKRLHFLIYDMELRTESILPIHECPKQKWECFDGAGNEFHFTLL